MDRMKEESKKAVLQLVDMECGYLTVEFFRKLPQDIEKGGNPTHSIFDRYNNESYLRRIGSTVLAYVNMVCATLRNSIPKSIVYCQVREAKRSLLDYFFAGAPDAEFRYALYNISALLSLCYAEIKDMGKCPYHVHPKSFFTASFRCPPMLSVRHWGTEQHWT